MMRMLTIRVHSSQSLNVQMNKNWQRALIFRNTEKHQNLCNCLVDKKAHPLEATVEYVIAQLSSLLTAQDV